MFSSFYVHWSQRGCLLPLIFPFGDSCIRQQDCAAVQNYTLICLCESLHTAFDFWRIKRWADQLSSHCKFKAIHFIRNIKFIHLKKTTWVYSLSGRFKRSSNVFVGNDCVSCLYWSQGLELWPDHKGPLSVFSTGAAQAADSYLSQEIFSMLLKEPLSVYNKLKWFSPITV